MKVLYFHLDNGMTERDEIALSEKITTDEHEKLKIRTASFEFFNESFKEHLESVERPSLVFFARSINSDQIMEVFNNWREILTSKKDPIYTVWIGHPRQLLLVNETITSIEEWDATEFLSQYSKVA